MEEVIRELVARKAPREAHDYDLALREAIQLIALLGLWRSKFFEHAAFYGGTALRILHGLPRFSEDIDFSLLQRTPDYSLQRHISSLQSELSSYGFETVVNPERGRGGAIESAFIKANTRKQLIAIEAAAPIAELVPRNQLLKVKLEVDTDPPPGFDTEASAILDPIPFYVRAFTLPDLFAGKMHRVLCRAWKSRVKGRDWYDLIWFLRNQTPVHLEHLEQRMRQSGHWRSNSALDGGVFAALYRERVEQTDFSRARDDVTPFVAEPAELDVWSTEFFLSLASRFHFV